MRARLVLMPVGPWRLWVMLTVTAVGLIPCDQAPSQRTASSIQDPRGVEGEGTVGLLMERDAGLGGWLDAEAVASAISRTRIRLRSTHGGVNWRVSLFCSSSSYDNKLAHEHPRESDGGGILVSIHPPNMAGCSGSVCLGGLVENAGAGRSMEDWGLKMGAMVVIGASTLPEERARMVAQACWAGGKSACALLPTEEEVRKLTSGNHYGAEARSSVERCLRSWVEGGGEVWARGPTEEMLLLSAIRPVKGRVVAIPWSAPEVVVRHADENGGMRQWSQARGRKDGLVGVVVLAGDSPCDAEAVVRACNAAAAANEGVESNGDQARVVMLFTVPGGVKEWALEVVEQACRGVEADVQEFVGGKGLRMAMTRADVCLCLLPCWKDGAGEGGLLAASREGVCGYSARRCLHAGLPVVAQDSWPANETVTHMHDGILIETEAVPVLAGALALLLSREVPAGLRTTLLRRLSAPQPGMLTARQYAQALHIQHRLAQREEAHPPRVVSLWPGPHELHRRTELFRSDALRRHGFDVREVSYTSNISQAAGDTVDFIVAAKPRNQDLARAFHAAQGAPVYVWTWDLIDYDGDSTRRAWFEGAARAASGAFLNELGREGMWEGLGGRVRYVGDGTIFIGDRGPGRRPSMHVEADSGSDVVFVGSVNATSGGDVYRLAVLTGLMREGIDVGVYGPEAQWSRVGVAVGGELWAREAAEVESGARVALSLSRSVSGLNLYHSDRLMRATAAGGCVVTNSFRGLDLLMPSGSVVGVREEDGSDAVLAAVRDLLQDSSRRTGIRARAEEVTWRRHTWEDAVGRFLRFIAGGLGQGEWDWDDKCSNTMYASVGWTLLRAGDAAEALVYLGFAWEDCPSSEALARAAALAALHSGELLLAQRLWLAGGRIAGGWSRGGPAASSASTLGLRVRAGGWVARGAEGANAEQGNEFRVVQQMLDFGDRELGVSCWIA